MSHPRSACKAWPALLGLASLPLLAIPWAAAQTLDPQVRAAEEERIAVIAKVSPSVVAIFSPGGQGGGSGVLISKDGYALSNFHVVGSVGPVMHCGLSDGNLYDAVLVGLDRVGDVALIKLLPKRPGQEFPAAVLGNSDTVRAGDWALALGNPFLLATDFRPTATYGLVSGVHRYQYPAGTLLEYTDCIQVDASINPGNSGGPLFNLNGELIGINGRGSFEKRGRVNTGVGYAISINQIKNFLGHLRAGIDTDHATLGATVRSAVGEEGEEERLIVDAIIENCDARRRGLDTEDELVSFAGRPMSSVNQYKNVLGLFPKGWRVPLVYRRGEDKHEILVRLMQLLPSTPSTPGARPTPPPRSKPPIRANLDSPALKLYEAKPGFANYYFNRLERDRLLAEAKVQRDDGDPNADWTIEGEAELRQTKLPFHLTIHETSTPAGSPSSAVHSPGAASVQLELGAEKYEMDPLRAELDPAKAQDEARRLKDPPGSGGLLMALYQWHHLLSRGAAGFEGYCEHGGWEPVYPYPADGRAPKSLGDLRVDAEVLRTEHAAVPVKWYFARADHALAGFEVSLSPDEDPCEVYLADYRSESGRPLPHRIEVRYGNDRYAVINIKSYALSPSRPVGG